LAGEYPNAWLRLAVTPSVIPVTLSASVRVALKARLRHDGDRSTSVIAPSVTWHREVS
jgi:hypothetical protein